MDKEQYIDVINRAMGDLHANSSCTVNQIGEIITALMESYDYYNKG